jgi:hypothetical protein
VNVNVPVVGAVFVMVIAATDVELQSLAGADCPAKGRRGDVNRRTS